MADHDIDALLEKARREKSYFDDPEELEGSAEERWARIERDPTMARVLGVDPEDFPEKIENQ